MGQLGTLTQVARAVALARQADSGARVVLTNGAFDLLHVGHLRCLQAARRLGDILVVAINSDASVRRAKGPGRPLVPAAERAELVSQLLGVDWALLFEEDTVASVIQVLRPEVHAKGTDYTAENVPERAIVEAYGGRVIVTGDPKDHSTTDILLRLRAPALGETPYSRTTQ